MLKLTCEKFLGERKYLSRALFVSIAISLENSEIEDNSSREKLNVQLRVIKIVFVHPLPTKIRFSPPLQKFIFSYARFSRFCPVMAVGIHFFFFSPGINA